MGGNDFEECLQSACASLQALCSHYRSMGNQTLLSTANIALQDFQFCLKRCQLRKSMLLDGLAKNVNRPFIRVILLSIADEFDDTTNWLKTNDSNLRSHWDDTQVTAQLTALNSRVTTSFMNKMALALLEVAQNHFQAVQKPLLPEQIPQLVKDHMRDGSLAKLTQCLLLLKEEQMSAKGFIDPGPKLAIKQLVDIVANMEQQTASVQTSKSRAASDSGTLTHVSTPSNGRLPLDLSCLDINSESRQKQNAPRTAPIQNPQTNPFLSLQEHRMERSRSDDTTQKSRATAPIKPTRRNGSSSRLQSIADETLRAPPSRLGFKATSDDQVVIGFNPVDATTKQPIIDPVLCSDNLIHCRWQVIYGLTNFNPNGTFKSYQTTHNTGKQELDILGELPQLRDALFAAAPERQREFHTRRQTFRDRCLSLCGPEGHTQLRNVVWHLSHVISFEPSSTAVPFLVRRAIAYYRLRDLHKAHADLSRAVDISVQTRGKADLDALRYRAMVREMCHDIEGCQADLDEITKTQHKADGLAFALKASLKASAGMTTQALADLEKLASARTESALKRTSDVARENVDLLYLASGWAKASVGLYEDAIADFNAALHQRLSVEPYVLASRGLAQIGMGAIDAGLASLHEAFEEVDENPSTVVEVMPSPLFGIPSEEKRMATFDLYFLRGMASYYLGQIGEALADFERGLATRPTIVQDTGEFRFLLASCRAAMGDLSQAQIDVDTACSLKPNQRAEYREQLRQHLDP